MHERVCQSVVQGDPVAAALLSSPVFGNSAAIFSVPSCEADRDGVGNIRRLLMPALVRVPADMPR